MTIEEIKVKMKALNIRQVDIVRELGYNKGNVSKFLNKKAPKSFSSAMRMYIEKTECENFKKHENFVNKSTDDKKFIKHEI